MQEQKPKCVVCEKSSAEVPLLALQFQDQQYWICPQHFPILIHQPEKLVGRLPGAENLSAGEH